MSIRTPMVRQILIKELKMICFEITKKVKFTLVIIAIIIAMSIGVIIYFSAPVQATIKTVKTAVKVVKTVRKLLKRRRNRIS